MKKTLARLRLRKDKAVDRMAALNALATKDNRELTAAEKLEYDGCEADAQELSASIAEMEQELAAQTPAGTPAAQPPAGQSPAAGVSVNDGIRLERERVADIDTAASTFLKRGEIDGAFVDTFKRDGKTVDQFKAAIAEKLAARSDKDPISGSHPTGAVTADAREKQREGMTKALLHRYDPKLHKIDTGNEFRSMSLLRIAEECLTAAGVKGARSLPPMELATLALASNGAMTLVGESGIERLAGMSTSDFPFITANVANKSLRAAYEAESQTFREFCRQTTSRDFKAKYVNQLGDAPDLEKVNESGEFKYGKIPEARESYALVTYGKILPFTRQALINDDMGAFTRLPELQGRAVARKESDVVWALLTSNPTMGDGTVLFHATHGNLPTAAALSATSWAAAKAAMRKQKGLAGTEPLNLEAKYLLTGSDNELVAMQLTSTNFTPTTQGAINPWAGRVTPIIESRLDTLANAGKAWIAVADPSRIDTIEFSYLEGQPGAYLETRMGFHTDGMEFKVRLDFGAAVIDWRSFVKNIGA